MYGAFGFYGDAVSDLAGKVKAKRDQIKEARKAVWKTKILTNARRLAELKVRGLTVELRTLQAQLAKAKRDARRAKRKGGAAAAAPAAAAPSSATLTPQQIAAVQALIQQMTAQGADADAAEEEAKRRVLPPALLAAVPRGFFRGVRRAGPRPALPLTQPRFYRPMPGEFPGPTRPLDPFVAQRDIDPRVFARPIDPIPRVRSVDPFVPSVPLIPQAGAFTFPPGNLSDTDPSLAAEVEADEGEDMNGIVDTVKEYAAKPWFLALAGIGALMYLRRRKKSSASVKSNPRRRRSRRSRRNRR
jgi:hypothetical protein